MYFWNNKASLLLSRTDFFRLTTNDIRENTEQILQEIRDVRQNESARDFILQRFLANSESYTETVREQSTVAGDDTFSMYQTSEPEAMPTRIPSVTTPTDLPSQNSLQTTQQGVLDNEGVEPNILRSDMFLASERDIESSNISRVVVFAFSPDNRNIVTGDDAGYIENFDLISLKPLHRIHAHNHEIRNLAFSPDGKHLASNDRNFINIWDGISGTILLALFWNGVQSLGFSINGTLLSATERGLTQVWDTKTGTCKAQREGIGHKLDVSADGTRMVCVYSRETNPPGMLSVRNTEDLTVRQVCTHVTSNEAVAISSHGTWFAYRPRGEALHVHRTSDVWTRDIYLSSMLGTILSMVFFEGRSWLACCFSSGSLVIYDFTTGDEVRKYDLEFTVYRLRVSVDGKWLVAITIDHKMKIWSIMEL
jgi:WD40 repeat protein